MRALEGITVLELSRVLAGPWCGMTLADLGADVIKLEPFTGDDTRGLGPPFLEGADGTPREGMSAYFACCNRGKRSLAIDLRAPAARLLLDALVRSADVLIENFRTGTAEALGVGWERLSVLNPRLVYCSISGYGRDGPGAMRAGYDVVVQAEAAGVVAGERLELDHVGAEVGQQHAAPRAGEDPRQFEDGDAFQGAHRPIVCGRRGRMRNCGACRARPRPPLRPGACRACRTCIRTRSSGRWRGSRNGSRIPRTASGRGAS